MKGQYIKPLTSMRFIFSMMVFLSHITVFIETNQTLSLKWLSFNLFSEGYIGVSFFFILSGFILSYSYQQKIISNKVSQNEFIINRITRIYPLHFLTVIVSIPLVLISIDSGRDFLAQTVNLFLNITLIQSFVPVREVYFGFNSPSWSISNEIFFYVVAPLLFKRLMNVNNKNAVLFILIVTFFIWIGIYLVPVKYYHSIFYISPITRVFDFIIGIILFQLFKNNVSSKYSTLKLSILETVSILLFIVFFYFHREVPQVLRYSIYYWIPMMIIIFVFSIGGGLFSNILSKQWLIYLGKISFGFYLIHQLVIRYFSILIEKFEINLDSLLQVLIVFSFSLLLSILSFEFFENKVRIKFKKYLMNKFIAQQ